MSIEKAAMEEKIATGVAHSKLILVGEHAVVHGQPAIAIPFPLIGVESAIQHVIGGVYLESALYKGLLDNAPLPLGGIVTTVQKTMALLNLPYRDTLIRIKSSIPPGKGLGSSASVAIAIVKSLFNYADEKLSQKQLLDLANISEKYAHGAPSGIDSLTITSPHPIWYQKDDPVDYIKMNGEFYFVVADTGQMADTKTSVETVKKLLKLAPQKMYEKIEHIGDITNQVRAALEQSSKHLLGQLLNEAQAELEAIGVSDSKLNHLIKHALKEGALGAKLTGGGNGGCILALADNELHAKQLGEKLKKVGAVAVWPFVLKEKN